ncbi:MAG TPA: MurR/RpiR family transcriptional regulator [Paracoccaceae bacterium]|nr:MurR/RpiR family transcriptional regulator [Paracoccaceae bacterium]HMO70148.1 MurR/RpiR family transcriptional regulator [Paracoccaceae bacterium]
MTPLAEAIQQRADRLTPSEQRLVSAVLAQPRQAALATVTDLAREAGVHEATVSRLARKLGFDGYPAFRSALQSEFLPTEETATRLQRTLQTAAGSGVLATLVAEETAALANLRAHVDEAQIAGAAARLIAARRLFVFARGNAEALAMAMAKRFRRFGRDVHLLTGDARSLAEGVLGMGSGDVLLVYALRRTPRPYAALVDHARARSVPVIAISDTLGPMLVPAPDMVLSAPRSGDVDGFQTLTVPMAISNAIVLAAGAREEMQTLQTLETLGSLIKRFE